jgi:hypothetical protein
MPLLAALAKILIRALIGKVVKKTSKGVVKWTMRILLLFLVIIIIPWFLCTAVATAAIGASVSALADQESSSSSSSLSGGGSNAPVVKMAKEIADHLVCTNGKDGNCTHNTFASGFPQSVITYGNQVGGGSVWQSGNFQCVSLVRGAYSQVYPMKLSANATDLWDTYKGQAGWVRIAGSSSYVGGGASLGWPAPGDVLIMGGGSQGYGHAAIIIEVDKKAGKVRFANGNANVRYDDMSISPSGVAKAPWNNFYVKGYLRPDFHYIAREDAKAGGIDPTNFERQIQQESGFQIDVSSSAGAQGIAQFLPSTAKGWGVDDPMDPFASLKGAVKMMKSKLNKYGDWAHALAAYNAGDGNVDKAIRNCGSANWRNCLPSETQNYIRIILRE